jgi:hypothetical protein
MAEEIRTVFGIEARLINLDEKTVARLKRFGDAIKQLPRDKVKITISGTTAGTIEKKAQAAKKLGLEMRKLKQVGSVNLKVDGNMKRVAADTQKMSASMKQLQGAADRLGSRVAFLLTAFVAQFATDVVMKATKEYTALEGQIRGLEIASARAGIAGSLMFRDLTAEVDSFNFKVKDAADAINKLIIGGLEPSVEQVRLMKLTAQGAAVLFGEDPSQMMNDLAKAALRTSRKIADNLGIVIRANETYERYAASLGRTVASLTASEKAQAFLNEMLTVAGAEALRAAASLKTTFTVMTQGEVQVNNLYLAFGKTISEGIVPMVSAFNRLKPPQLEAIANNTLFTVKLGATVVAAKMLGGVLTTIIPKMKAFAAIQAAGIGAQAAQGAMRRAALAGTVGMIGIPGMGEPSALRGAHTPISSKYLAGRGSITAAAVPAKMIAGFAALAAAVVLTTAVMDNHNKRLAEMGRLQLGVVQSGAMFQGFLASLDLAPMTDIATGQLSELEQGLASAMESAKSFTESLVKAVDKIGLTDEKAADLKRTINTLTDDGMKKFTEATDDGRDANGEYAGSLEDIALMARDILVPAITDVLRVTDDARIAQIVQLCLSDWGLRLLLH